jgi:hypothetical protein
MAGARRRGMGDVGVGQALPKEAVIPDDLLQVAVEHADEVLTAAGLLGHAAQVVDVVRYLVGVVAEIVDGLAPAAGILKEEQIGVPLLLGGRDEVLVKVDLRVAPGLAECLDGAIGLTQPARKGALGGRRIVAGPVLHRSDLDPLGAVTATDEVAQDMAVQALRVEVADERPQKAGGVVEPHLGSVGGGGIDALGARFEHLALVRVAPCPGRVRPSWLGGHAQQKARLGVERSVMPQDL